MGNILMIMLMITLKLGTYTVSEKRVHSIIYCTYIHKFKRFTCIFITYTQIILILRLAKNYKLYPDITTTIYC